MRTGERGTAGAGNASPASWKRVTHSDSYRRWRLTVVGAPAGERRLRAGLRPFGQAAAFAPPCRPSASGFADRPACQRVVRLPDGERAGVGTAQTKIYNFVLLSIPQLCYNVYDTV